MLFRELGEAAVAIPQPSHSWLSGQLARAWGGDGFAPPAPFEEVALGAEQHDIGWLGWESAPTLDRETGRPHDFRAVGADTHTALWREGVEHARAFGLYPALLVSLHARTIYGSFFDFAKAPPAEAALVRRFLGEQEELRDRMIAGLRGDERLAGFTDAPTLERNRLLVATVDRMSLELCWGIRREVSVADVPRSGEERTVLRLSPGDGASECVHVTPWPFATERLRVRCAGVAIRGRFADEGAMRAALADPLAATLLEIELLPA
jgi:hypothetical protein